MSTTLLALEQSIGNELGRVSGTCSAAGTTTTISDTSTDSPFDPDDENTLYKNAWAKIEADSAVTPLNVGEVRRVSSYSVGTSVTTSRAFPNATTTTQSYGIYQNLPPARVATQKGIKEYINDTLRSLLHREYTPLTYVYDGDMELTATTWVVGGTATLSKSTTWAALGKQSLRVVNAALADYARCATFNVVPSRTYTVLADVYAATGTARLVLYDVTNSATIDDRICDVKASRTIYFEATIPSTCLQVQVRLVGDETTADVYWDNVSVRPTAATYFDLPSWLTNPMAIEEVELWGGGTGRSTTSSEVSDYAIDERYPEPVFWWRVQDDATGSYRWRLEVSPAPTASRLLVVRSLRPYAELSADTDTTDANADLILAGALLRYATDKKDKALIETWAPRYADALRSYQPRWSKRIMPPRPV